MKPFSKAILRIGTESAFAVGPEIKSWEDEGYNIIRLNIGEPGCNISKSAKKSAIESFKKNQTHYTPASGDALLRKEIGVYLSATRGIDYYDEEERLRLKKMRDLRY